MIGHTLVAVRKMGRVCKYRNCVCERERESVCCIDVCVCVCVRGRGSVYCIDVCV